VEFLKSAGLEVLQIENIDDVWRRS
jgi:hypothetical protein